MTRVERAAWIAAVAVLLAREFDLYGRAVVFFWKLTGS